MPQLTKGGKYIFGISTVKKDFSLQFPKQAVEEYKITADKKIIIFTGSKITGGFCVTNYSLLSMSKLQHILSANPALQDCKIAAGEFVKYKGRSYAWLPVSTTGLIYMNREILDFLNIDVGSQLLSIRSSNIAFTMGAKGPLMDKANHYDGEIERY